MAITIIDSFSVSHAGPIDNRTICRDSAARVDMGLTSVGSPYSFVYDGLKVFQLDDRTNWVWNGGLGTWSSDNSGSIDGDVVKVPYLTFWTASNTISYAPIHITQSDNLQIAKFLYLGGSQSLPYDSVIGLSDTNWLTLASSNNLNGVQIRSNTNLSDKINSGGQVTHKLYGDTTKSITKLFTSSGYAQISLDSSLDLSTDKSMTIRTNATAGVGSNITIDASDSSANVGGSVEIYSGDGLSTPGDITLLSGVDSTGFTKAGNIYLSTGGSGGYGGSGYFVDPKSGFVEVVAPFKSDYAVYERCEISSTNNMDITILDYNKNIVLNNIGSSGILANLPDLVGKYDGRRISIQCATLSNTVTLTPYGSQKIYHKGSFQSSVVLYSGYSIELISSNQNWYAISSTFVDESWKSIGSGGTFQNGQSVPNFAYSTSTSTMQVRKTSSNKVAIRGYVNLSGPWVSGQTLFTLPIGYRPSTTSLIVTEAGTASQIYLFTNGSIVVGGYSGLTFVGIPEIEVSLD